MITLPNGWKQISNNILVHNEIEPIHYTCVWALLFYLIKSDMYSWKQMDCTLHAWNLDMLKLTVDKDWHVLIHLVFTLILDRMKEQMRLQENIYTVKPLCPLWHLGAGRHPIPIVSVRVKTKFSDKYLYLKRYVFLDCESNATSVWKTL